MKNSSMRKTAQPARRLPPDTVVSLGAYRCRAAAEDLALFLALAEAGKIEGFLITYQDSGRVRMCSGGAWRNNPEEVAAAVARQSYRLAPAAVEVL